MLYECKGIETSKVWQQTNKKMSCQACTSHNIINCPKSKLVRLNMLFEQNRHDQKLWVENKLNLLLWSPLAVSQCVGAVWPKCCLCVCVLKHFSPCSAAPAAAFTFLHSQDHACTSKIYKSQNKNILSSIIAGQTSVSLLDCIFAPQQIAPDKRSGAANKCSESAQGLTVSYWHSLGFADCTWLTMTSTKPLDIS